MICSKCHQELSISKLFKIVKTEQLKRIFESETRFQMGLQAWRGQGQAGAGTRAVGSSAPPPPGLRPRPPLQLSQGTERPGQASRGPRTGQERLSGTRDLVSVPDGHGARPNTNARAARRRHPKSPRAASAAPLADHPPGGPCGRSGPTPAFQEQGRQCARHAQRPARGAACRDALVLWAALRTATRVSGLGDLSSAGDRSRGASDPGEPGQTGKAEAQAP